MSLAINKIYNAHPSYRVGQASELTKKARSPAQHLSLGMVPVQCLVIGISDLDIIWNLSIVI